MSEWPREIYDVLKEADIRQVSYAPDAGFPPESGRHRIAVHTSGCRHNRNFKKIRFDARGSMKPMTVRQ